VGGEAANTPEALTLALAEATGHFLLVLDEAGHLIYANPAFVTAILGGQSVNGQAFTSLMDHASAERAQKALRDLDGGQAHSQVELYHFEKDGCPRPIHYSLCRIHWSGRAGIAAIGRDKTPDLELLGEIVQLNMQLEEKQAQLADANARLEQTAVTDHLTGLYNRHHFFTVIQVLFEEARRYGLPMGCFMIDADHFKNLNDRYGHIFGDHVLKVVAERLRRSTRRSDVLARYGGEEFVLVAPNTDLATASLLGERLRVAVESEPFVLGNTSAKGAVSVGLAGTETVTAGAFEDLLHAADQALYAAKEGGRNRVVVYNPQLKSLQRGKA
jgi:diguanylate cyclase (GGDEF)-like protein/PAS domain S-box-containing protein